MITRGVNRAILAAIAFFPAVVTAAALVANSGTGATGWSLLWVLLALVLGIVLAYLVAPVGDRGFALPDLTAGRAPPEDISFPAPLVDVAAERSVLVELCIGLDDDLVVKSHALRAQIRRLLAEVGVSAIDVPPGAAFNPDLEDAVEATDTIDRNLHNTVAQTVRVGYRDHDCVIRRPSVVVYRVRS